ncbi:MAG: tetratricopeptide repeat protein, partial [bacterium]|nr:tetratricopeptide repeat protein [bacterium]
RYKRAGGRSPRLLKKLASLEEELGRTKDAAETLERLNYIYPVGDEEMHRHLGDLWLAEENLDAAIREYRAVVALKPVDPATAHYNLAKAYRAADKTDEALKHVVMSLSVAHGFRPAQKMLLELSEKGKEE